MAVNTIKRDNSNVARTVWCFWLTACKYVSILKEFATDYSNASSEQCGVVLVWRFCNHKCRHGVMFTQRNATQRVISKNTTSLNSCPLWGATEHDTPKQPDAVFIFPTDNGWIWNSILFYCSYCHSFIYARNNISSVHGRNI